MNKENQTLSVDKREVQGSADAPSNGSGQVRIAVIIVLVLSILAVGALIWLSANNVLHSVYKNQLQSPVEGKFARIVSLSTYWANPPENGKGMRSGVILQPAVSLSISEGSTSGWIRIYFRNDENTIMGDPVTMRFENGLFSNMKTNFSVVCTDGLHSEKEMLAYSLYKSLSWKVEVLEAGGEKAPRGNDFIPLLTQNIDTPER